MPNWNQKLSPVLLKQEFYEDPTRKCRLIIEMASPYPEKIKDYVEANEGKVHGHLRVIPSVVVEVPYSALPYMALSPHVKKIWHDTKVRTLLNIAVPASGGEKAHDLGFTGKGVTVAVIDTGISPHFDLMLPQNRIVGWYDIVNDRATPYDDNGHGTHVSGIIAGNGAISRGKYTGMAPEANLVGVKVLDSEGSGNTSDVITAIEWCIENQKTYDIKAINLSLGSAAQDSYREDPLCRAIAAAWRSGITVCVAAGNDGPDSKTINTPGITPTAITVGNLDDKETVEPDDDEISNSSSRGPTIDNLIKPDILAPGTNIMSLRAGGGYLPLSGTSMATPMVTGAVAQIYQKWPSLKPDQVKNLLVKNARSLGFQAIQQGSGALNMGNVFEEPQPSETKKANNLFTMLFGGEPPLKKISTKKPGPEAAVIKAASSKSPARQEEKPVQTTMIQKLAPLALAALAIFPLIL